VRCFRAGFPGSPVLLLFFVVLAFKFSQESRMLQKALVLVFVLATLAGCIGCSNTASQYVYATVPVENQILAYREDPNSGVLTELSGSPFSAGEGARSVVVHPSGKFLYVANPGQGGTGENDISLFDIASNGIITEITPRTSVAPNGSQPQLLIMDPAGAYLYVMNAGSNNISVFSIASSNGALTQVPNSPFNLGLPPLNMQLTPSGNYLYVSTTSEPYGTIATFSVNSGQLSLIATTSTGGLNPYGLVIDATGAYLYAANYGSNSISVFSIGSSGALGTVQGSPIADGYSAPFSMIFDPSGNYLYVANQSSNNVSAYSISSNGLPTALTTSTSTNAFGTELSPSVLAEDPSGKYLFVANQGSGAAIQGFSVSSGTLTAIHIYGIGNTPSSMAILKQ
jgi:6-phosphogluconolactonase (cycloisomerase 2 family)